MKFKSITKRVSGIALLALLFVSCKSTFFQVVTLGYSENVKPNEGYLVSENNDLKLLYNFWREGLYMKFDIINKTDKDVFIILPQSFCIKNNLAIPYSENKITSSSSYSSSNFSGTIVTTQSTQAYNNLQFACIPPHSYITIGSIPIINERFTDCNPKHSFPSDYFIYNYLANNTPLQLQNRIAYSFNRDFSTIHYIDNIFFVSSYINSKGTKGETFIPKCDDNAERFITTKVPVQNPMPNMFYIEYEGTEYIELNGEYLLN